MNKYKPSILAVQICTEHNLLTKKSLQAFDLGYNSRKCKLDVNTISEKIDSKIKSIESLLEGKHGNVSGASYQNAIQEHKKLTLLKKQLKEIVLEYSKL